MSKNQIFNDCSLAIVATDYCHTEDNGESLVFERQFVFISARPEQKNLFRHALHKLHGTSLFDQANKPLQTLQGCVFRRIK